MPAIVRDSLAAARRRSSPTGLAATVHGHKYTTSALGENWCCTWPRAGKTGPGISRVRPAAEGRLAQGTPSAATRSLGRPFNKLRGSREEAIRNATRCCRRPQALPGVETNGSLRPSRPDPGLRADGRFEARTTLSVSLTEAGISDPSRPLGLRAGNGSSCPIPVVRQTRIGGWIAEIRLRASNDPIAPNSGRSH